MVFYRSATCTNGTLAVNYTMAGNATNGVNYAASPASGSLVITNGATNAALTITPLYPWNSGTARTIRVSLAVGSYVIGSANVATCTLVSMPMATNNTPLWWLAQYNLPTNDAGAMYEDGDGMPAWQEYIAGTDPTNALSVLRIVNVSGGRATFSPAFTNRIYAVLSATNVASTNWLPLSLYQAGTGTLTSLALTNTAPQMFFRIGVRLP